jgi:hypothetical protein
MTPGFKRGTFRRVYEGAYLQSVENVGGVKSWHTSSNTTHPRHKRYKGSHWLDGTYDLGGGDGQCGNLIRSGRG